MTSPFSRQPNDIAVHSIEPARPSDPRVRLAPEDALQGWISAYLAFQSRASEWAKVQITVGTRSVTVNGDYLSKLYPSVLLSLANTINIPAIPNLSDIVKREERLYLVLFGAITGGDQDAVLGQVSFQYLDRNTNTLTPTTKENAKRDRIYWALVLSPTALTAESFYQSLTQEVIPANQEPRLTGDRVLTVSNKTADGFVNGTQRIFALDPSLTQGATYPILQDFVEVTEVCRIVRQQNYLDRGYTFGNQGEEQFDAKYVIMPAALPKVRDIDSRIADRLIEIFSGKPGPLSCYSRTVQNLTAGLVGGNPGRAGESAASPNGSVCLANDNRVSFSNQALLQRLGVQITTATPDGNGAAVVTAQLNTNSPPGTVFSEKPSDHRIFKADGTEQSELGQFINLGQSGALVWVASQNSTIQPGNIVYFVPGIQYPSGSGFDIPFEEVERTWRNGTPISAANIRSGHCGDLQAYEAPANNESYIAVFGKERAALHYIYKKVQVPVDSNGTALIPSAELGCFAFIEGATGRIDAPVKTGLTPNTMVNALVYYPPRSTESWQAQFRYCPYQGTSAVEPNFLDGAIVISKPYFWMTTQGGGNSVFQADSSIRYSPISMHLPLVENGIPCYRMDAAIRYYNEPNPGPSCTRPGAALSGAGLAMPTPGMTLSLVANPGIGSGKSLHAVLKSNGVTVGFRNPILNRQVIYQSIIAFLVRKGQEERLVIATFTGDGGDSVEFDSTQGCAFDTFRI